MPDPPVIICNRCPPPDTNPGVPLCGRTDSPELSPPAAQAQPRIPAAQYLRVSTNRQECSLAKQAARISLYAARNNFEIIATYSDEGKSGLTLKNRRGIQQLLGDVMAGPAYNAVLVYDVSRWGRYQDLDEGAHYEFVCRSAGVAIHYCADNLANSTRLSDALLKSLKRAAAAEYSRELGVKVFAGQRRLIAMGFSMGGTPPYGFRRLLVDCDGRPKQLLQRGERKSLASDRVRYALGPEEEVSNVRTIFDLAASLVPMRIVEQLNQSGATFRGRPWTFDRVTRILDDPRYRGAQVWARTTQRLQPGATPAKTHASIIVPGTLPVIVDQQTYDRIQPRRRCPRLSDQEILEFLDTIQHEQGAVDVSSVTARNGLTYRTIARRFGTLRQALERIGATFPARNEEDHTHQRQRWCAQIVHELYALFPLCIEASGASSPSSPRFRVDQQHVVAVVVVPHLHISKTPAWVVRQRCRFDPEFVLCGLLNREHTSITQMCILAWPRGKHRLLLRENSPELRNPFQLGDLRHFYQTFLTVFAATQK